MGMDIMISSSVSRALMMPRADKSCTWQQWKEKRKEGERVCWGGGGGGRRWRWRRRGKVKTQGVES